MTKFISPNPEYSARFIPAECPLSMDDSVALVDKSGAEVVFISVMNPDVYGFGQELFAASVPTKSGFLVGKPFLTFEAAAKNALLIRDCQKWRENAAS